MKWLAESVEDDRVVFRIGRDGPHFIAEWIGLLRVVADGAGAVVSLDVAPNSNAALIAKLQNGPIRGLLRHLRGELTLHAAAVSTGVNAIALVGDTGAGKSTLAFALATRDEAPFALLSDDCLAIDRDCAMPSEGVGWLDAPARSALHLSTDAAGKSAATPKRVAQAPARLSKIVHLVFGEHLGIRRLRGHEAVPVLARAMIRFIVDDPEVNRADMNRLAELASRAEILELSRPRSLDRIAESIALLQNPMRAT